MSYSKRIKRIKSIGLSLLLLFCLSVPVSVGKAAPAAPEGPGFIEELKLFSKALGVIEEAYVNPVDARQMLYEAVKGMLSSLDKHSEFIDPQKFEILQIHIRGEYAGIGIMMEIVNEFPGVKGVKPGSPAARADVRPGDFILKIDGESVKGWALPDVASKLRGEAGQPITLTVNRVMEHKIFDIEIIRENIEIESVQDVRMVGRQVGYFRIANWQERTPGQIDKALSDLSGQGMKALIIDLRDNDGGLLPSAVALSERFLEAGKKIVSVASKVEEQRKEYVSSGEFTLKEIPKLFILVNEKSASASEIFSAAMQDYGLGTLVGVQTYGKASVQSVIPLDDRSAMKLTTASYRSPQGRDINHVGLTPDVIVEKDSDSDGPDWQILKVFDLLKEYM
ncbi:MAG: S41 family peptidase [Candidatus Omnitrophica bacterium]|nr:S41 family peptidase [Candidatus Omnitrophota bacterium]